ncbi:MAG: tetratricopeptide repeat protein [Deltaproteobacteria bacterium]|nr:tetratricopeptide repeat protein [Deltaproteobacteria bacterium]
MDKQDKSASVQQMIAKVINTVDARQAKLGKNAPMPSGPLFTFLLGAGFSVTAGVPDVRHLVSALEYFRKSPKTTWQEIFDSTSDKPYGPVKLTGVELTEYYFRIMAKILPLPQARHDFITAAVQWAASKRMQMNLEGILLSSILIAGTGGNVPLSRSRSDRHWLSRCFARHVFTTNFDEVLPTTFYYGNQPVEIIDGSAERGISAAAEYPVIAYLHGRHLHFDIRNTPQELKFKSRTKKDKDKTKEVDRDIFIQFRNLLRSTGLIVIGYSGAMDMVTEYIIDAIDDPNSLPYGLWWVAYKDIGVLHPKAQSLIDNYERAFYLDPGKDAEQLMRLISQEIGIDEISAIRKWTRQLKKVSSGVNMFLKRVQYDFRKFQMDAAMASLTCSDAEIRDILNQWQEMEKYVLAHGDKVFVGELLSLVTKLMVSAGAMDDAAKLYGEAIALAGKTGNEKKLGQDLLGMSSLYFLEGNLEMAGNSAVTAFDLFRKYGMGLAEAGAIRVLGDICLMKGDTDTARKKYREAAEKCGGESHAREMAHNIKGLADILMVSGKYGEAREKYEEALSMHLDDGDEIWAAADRRGIGESFLLEGKPEEAEKLFEESLESERGMDYGRGVAYDLKYMADVCSLRKDFDRAGMFISESRELFSIMKDVRGELELKRTEGLNNLRMGDRDTALRRLSAACAEAKDRGYMLIAGIIEKDMENIRALTNF